MKHSSRPHLIRRLAAAPGPLLLALFAGALSCSDDGGGRPKAPGAPDLQLADNSDAGPINGCVDRDGDGYGFACTMGSDCDDSDPTITMQCLCENESSPGCPCTGSGEQVSCGTVYSRVGDQVVCGEGISTCDGSSWGECIINGAVTIKSASAASGLDKLALGGPSPCANNPCDPKCTTFTDTTAGLSFSSDTGVVAGPTGVTLPSSDAIVVPGIVSSGFDCKDSAYPANPALGSCAHHICRVGTALADYCDGAAPVTVPTTIFSDNFSSSSGWTTGANWEIGATSASSGHSSGNADPASDTTSGSDNKIAGTVLGGNIGGPFALLAESFTNLNSWTESGFDAESRDSSGTSYPGTGNPVAHSDNCDSGCTLTLTSGLNLAGYSSATLSFNYFLDSELDNGEGLKVDIFNGSSWSQILSRASEADDDNVWRNFSLALNNSQRANGFKVRFTAQSSSSDETIEVDDVLVTVPPSSTTSYLTSPVFNGSASVGDLTLSFRRWLNLNSDFVGKVELFNGSSWVALYTSSGAVSDSSWQTMNYNITAYKAANNQLRFSYSGSSNNKVSGWNIDDVVVSGTSTTAGSSLCVHKVCQSKPACCTTGWTLDCVEALASTCKVECSVDTAKDNACTACFGDPTLTVDVDGDGLSPAQGDCRECDPTVNAGAYDLPGNHVDENCDGTPDNEVTTCDSSLSSSGDAMAHAKALGLCKVASGNSWGVVSAAFVRADGVTPCTDGMQYHIKSSFGSGNLPTEGKRMSVFSSGTARVPGESGFVVPNGDGYNAKTFSKPAHSIPSAAGCKSGDAGYDSCGLKLVLKAPTNANSFAYNFNFFTSEYPEWLCTSYNDAYAAFYYGALNTAANKNISFDSAGNPVSVNNGLFGIPGGWPPLAKGSHPLLDGSGFDKVCENPYNSSWTSDSICGGSTGWLSTTAPVKPGEQITLTFNVWDTGDYKWDSTVLLDRFTWSTSSASITTGHYTPGSEDVVIPPTYTTAAFNRDYDMSGTCDDDYVPLWSLWSWTATTPDDSKVEFYVQAAATKAGLDTAPLDALVFSSATGPTALVGQSAVARAGTPDTRNGSVVVHDTLKKYSRDLNAKYVRVSAKLVPSSDKLSAPTLNSWNLQTSCQVAQ